MIIRPFKEGDLEELKRLHENYFADEFTFEEFTRSSIGSLVCEEEGRIVSATNLRTLLEMVTITDKNASYRTQREALLKSLFASLIFSGRTNHDGLHAFVQDEKWSNLLKRIGFRETVGKSLFIG